MGLMETMRSGTDSTLMQVVLALVVISFVAWGVNQGQERSQAVAVVNGEWIMDTELARELRERSARFERSLAEDERAALREQVRQDLIRDTVLNQEARRLGLAVSDAELARLLLTIPAFRNARGDFDDDRYLQFVRRQGYTKAQFEERLRGQLLRDKLRNLVFFGVTVSEPVLREAFERRATRIDLQYVRIRPALLQDDVEVDEAERRRVLSEDEGRVRAEYERDLARRYDLPERVDLRVIRLSPDEGEDLDALAARLAELRAEVEGGASFAALAERWSEDPSAARGGSLGLVPTSQLDEAAREAVAAVEPGGISEVVRTEHDVRLYEVLAREPARLVSYDEAAEEIAERLIRQEKAPALATAFAQRVLTAWRESGAPPEDLLLEQGLTALDTGPMSLDAPPSPFSPPGRMIGAAERAEPGTVLPEVYESDDGMLWVGALTSREDPDAAMFEIERERIRDEILLARRAELFEEWLTARVAEARIR